MINREGFQRHNQQSPVVNPLDQQYTQVQRISFTVPVNSFAMDLGLIPFAISMTSSRDMLPECLMFFTFLRSRSGSLRALMTRAAAETLAWRFWTVSLTQTLPMAMSSPIFFGERPSDEAAPTSPPVTHLPLEKDRTSAAAMAFKFIMDVVLYRYG